MGKRKTPEKASQTPTSPGVVATKTPAVKDDAVQPTPGAASSPGDEVLLDDHIEARRAALLILLLYML